MALTAQQLNDLRADLGVDSTIFSDSELERLWDRVSGASNDTQRHEATLALMARQLWTSSAKLHDYTAGQSSEKLSQVVAQLKAVYADFRPALDAALNQRQQFVIGAVRAIPNQRRVQPIDDSADQQEREWPDV